MLVGLRKIQQKFVNIFNHNVGTCLQFYFFRHFSTIIDISVAFRIHMTKAVEIFKRYVFNGLMWSQMRIFPFRPGTICAFAFCAESSEVS